MSNTPLSGEPRRGQSLVLLLRPREAALALGISERTLWTLAQRRAIRPVRIGRAVAYSVDDLREFIRHQQEGHSNDKQ